MLKLRFKTWDCIVSFRWYGNGRRAIVLYEDSPMGERVAVATVNVPEAPLASDEVFVRDSEENEGMLAALVAAGIVEPTGRTVESGFITAPVCRLLVNTED